MDNKIDLENFIDKDEIIEAIRKRIESYTAEKDTSDFGTVVEVGDGIARIEGLSSCHSGELLSFPSGQFGMAMNLEEDNVGAVIIGSDRGIREGDIVKATGHTTEVPTGSGLLGRVVDPLGRPLDEKGRINYTNMRPIEYPAPGVLDRRSVYQPLQTGIKAIDAMIPIGKGQRELIIGDRQTGKTAIAIDTIINQRGTDVICIYVAIGQSMGSTSPFTSSFGTTSRTT